MTNATEAAPEAMLPKGVKDFLPIKAAKIGYLQQTLLQIFSQWGFRPIIPPSLEHLHVLERGLGAGLREKTFRFDDRQSGKLVAFPPDITPQVARIVATRMREMPLPLRLCYAGRVLRHTEQQAGKDREIFQAGVELIGLESPEADAEMIAMAVECLKALGAREFTIDIGQVEFFRGVMADLSLSDALSRQVREAIAHKDSSGLQALLENAPLSDQSRCEILALPRLFGGREVLEKAGRTVANERSRRALENLGKVLEVLAVYGVEEHVTFDLGELRGLDYHTGLTFQGFLPGLGRAVCFGGRYDSLLRQCGAPRDVPALLAGARVFAFPAVREGLGLAVAEALMLGIPVVAAHDGGGVSDIVPAAGGGRLVAPDAAGFANAIRDLLDDPEARARAAEAGAVVRDRLSPEAVARVFEGVLGRVA